MKASREFVERYYADDLAEQGREESRWARQWLKEVKGDCVLDIGCGPQFFDDAVGFGKIPGEVVGVDLNETNIEFLRTSEHPALVRSKNFLSEHNVKVDFFVHDITVERPDFVDRFDSVFASGVLGMFDEQDTAHIFSLLHRYLKSGGEFVMVSWGDDRLSPEKFAERNRYGWYWRKGPGPEAIEHLLEKAGFKIIKKEIYTVPDPEEYEWGSIYGSVARK